MKAFAMVLVLVISLSAWAVPAFAQPPELIDAILADLSRRVGEASLSLDDLDQWTWTDEIYPDGGIGCPQAGQSYAQGSTRGYTFLLIYEGILFDYRSPRNSTTFWLCNNPDLSSLQQTANTPAPAASSTPQSTSGGSAEVPLSNFFPCPTALTGSVPSRLGVGFEVRYIGTITQTVQAEPSRTAAAVGSVQYGDTFHVIGGPTCSPTFTYWQVDTGSVVGWLPEVDPSNLSYWLEPIGGTSLPAVPLPSGEIPATRQAITAENAGQVVELARQTLNAPSQLLVGTSPMTQQGIAVITTADGLLIYSDTSPENPLETIGRAPVEIIFSADDSSVIGIEMAAGQLPGLGFYSTTGGGGGSHALDIVFTGGMALLSNLNLLALGGENSILLYDLASQQIAASLPLSGNPVSIAANGNTLAAAVAPDQVVLWDVSTRSQIALLANPLNPIIRHGLAFSPDGRFLAVSTAGGSVNIWDVQALAGFMSLPAYNSGGEVFYIAYSPDGNLIATAGGPPPVEGNFSDTPSLQLWDAATGILLGDQLSMNQLAQSLAFSEDGTLLHTISLDNLWQIWGVQ
jgi:hypothetical protein